MRKLIVMSMVGIFLMTGCSTFGGLKSIDPNYQAYTQSLKAQFEANKDPLVNISVTSEGKISGIIVNQPMTPVTIQQKNPHPVWAAFSGVVRICGIAGAIWATGDAVSSIIDAGSGTTTYTNSLNNNSDNSGSIVTDYITTDTVTDTVTTTDTK